MGVTGSNPVSRTISLFQAVVVALFVPRRRGRAPLSGSLLSGQFSQMMAVELQRENANSPAGVSLRRLLVLPDPGSPVRAGLVLVHGLGDHAERHLSMMREVARRGIACVATDLPGHGASGNPRGHIDSAAEIHGIIETAARRATELAPGCPLGIAGHSMGGLLVLDYFASGGGAPFSFVWLSSSLVKPRYRQARWRIAAARLASRVWPKLTTGSGVRLNECYDPDELGISRADERASGTHNRISVRWGVELLAAGERVAAAAGTLFADKALLMTHGTEDHVCPNEFARSLFDKVAASDKTFVDVPGARHEPWRAAEVVVRVADWIDRQLDALA